MTEADLLLRAIDDDPDDPAAYLVYADYLLDRGDPRGELIQLQLRLEAFDLNELARRAIVQREADLLELLAPVWEELDARYRFRRGFLHALDLPAEVFREHAPGAPDLVGLRELRLHDDRSPVRSGFPGDDLATALAVPSLRGLLELTFSGCWLDAAGGRALAAANLPRLRSLKLDDVSEHGPSAAVAALVAHPAPGLPDLESLALTTNRLTDDIAQTLAAWPPLAQLHALDLSSIDAFQPHSNTIGDRGAIALAASPRAARLARLHLGDNRSITNETAFVLAASTHTTQLVELNLSFTSIDDDGARALSTSPSLSQLEHLDLGHTRVGDAGVAALVRLPRLSTLRLSGTPLTADGIRSLVAAPAHLTSIRLLLDRLDLPPDLHEALLLRFGPTLSST